MTCQRFKQKQRFFRLDVRTRSDQNNPLYHVREKYRNFSIKVFQTYNPSAELNMDEQLFE